MDSLGWCEEKLIKEDVTSRLPEIKWKGVRRREKRIGWFLLVWLYLVGCLKVLMLGANAFSLFLYDVAIIK